MSYHTMYIKRAFSSHVQLKYDFLDEQHGGNWKEKLVLGNIDLNSCLKFSFNIQIEEGIDNYICKLGTDSL